MSLTMRRILEALAGLIVLSLAVAWLAGMFESRVAPGKVELPPQEDSAAGSMVEVALVTGPVAEWSSGTVASARQTAVAARVLARIEEVRVVAGDEVTVDEVLIRLDDRDFESRLSQGHEALRGAEARLKLAATEKDRFAELLRTGATTRRRVDEVTADLRVAEAEVARINGGIEEAETALSYTVIRSPVAGRVIDRLAEPGETASPGRPLLRIYDPSVLRVEAPVRETLAVNLAVGDTVAVEIPALDMAMVGTIDEIVPFAEPGARTLLVKVRLPQSPRVVAGMFARIAVPAGARARIVVPTAAIERIGQLEYALVAGADNRLERRLVTTGRGDKGHRVEILSGLSAGEKVFVKAGPDH